MKYQIVSPPAGKKLDVLPLLVHPEEFHGNTHVDCLVKFGASFTGLIGKHGEALPKDGVVILEQGFDDARKLMDKINNLAQAIIADQEKYDDVGFCREYFELAKAGYGLLAKQQKPAGIPVSLERAGLVTTRLALGLDRDDKIGNEVAVVTKRIHLVGEPETNLAVSVQWRDREKLKTINGQAVVLSDFVNPASGASGLAFVAAAKELGIKPDEVNHRSISCTRQGVIFVRKALDKLGINSTFYSVGLADELNQMFYLIGSRAVADAGQVLRHFLPVWYKI